MTTLKERRYVPDPAARRVYDRLYGMYRQLHDAFGGVAAAGMDFGPMMKRLLAQREEAR